MLMEVLNKMHIICFLLSFNIFGIISVSALPPSSYKLHDRPEGKLLPDGMKTAGGLVSSQGAESGNTDNAAVRVKHTESVVEGFTSENDERSDYEKIFVSTSGLLPPTATTKWSVVELLAAAPQQRDVNLDLFDKTLPPLSEKDDYSASSVNPTSPASILASSLKESSVYTEATVESPSLNMDDNYYTESAIKYPFSEAAFKKEIRILPLQIYGNSNGTGDNSEYDEKAYDKIDCPNRIYFPEKDGENVKIVIAGRVVYDPELAAFIYKLQRTNGDKVQKGTSRCFTIGGGSNNFSLPSSDFATISSDRLNESKINEPTAFHNNASELYAFPNLTNVVLHSSSANFTITEAKNRSLLMFDILADMRIIFMLVIIPCVIGCLAYFRGREARKYFSEGGAPTDLEGLSLALSLLTMEAIPDQLVFHRT